VAHDLTRESDRGRQVLVFQNKADIYRFVTDRFLDLSKRAVVEHNRFSVALSGGKTPIDLYTEIGRLEQGIDWKSIHLFLVDERVVPLDDSQSNYGMIKGRLLDAIPIPTTNVHAVAYETDPSTSARKYETELKKFFDVGPGGVPAFDLILLGMGEDGHTASLFPELPDLQNDDRMVRAIEPSGERVARVTLTLQVINHGRNVFFLVTGQAKARIVRRVVEEQDPSLPASLVRPVEGALIYLLDGEAGSMLSTGKAEKMETV
jgi:6-phosphogluconolactonase